MNKNKMSYDLIILSIGNSSKLYQKSTQGRNIEKDYKEIALTTTVKHNSKIDTASQFFLKQGPLAYGDKDKFPEGAWCKEKDWVVFPRYAGSRFKIEGGEVRILNDDEVIATIMDPDDILSY